MKIKGKHVLPTDIATLWPMLQDSKILTRISPGVSYIEKKSEDNYRAVSSISIGPVRGKFEGVLTLKDKKNHESMTMVLEQNSSIGNAVATIHMILSKHDEAETLVIYNGDAKVSGKLATMGQRILGGVVSTLTKQVFKELEGIILEENMIKANHKILSQKTTPSQSKTNIFQSIIKKITNIWKSLFR